MRYLLLVTVMLLGLGWAPQALAHGMECDDAVAPEISVVLVVDKADTTALPCEDCSEKCPHMAHHNGGCCKSSSCGPLVSLPEGHVVSALLPGTGGGRWQLRPFTARLHGHGLERPPKSFA